MNPRHKYLIATIRTVLGLFILFSGISGLMAVSSGKWEGVPEFMIPYLTSFKDSGIFYMIKITEVVAGLMLVANFLPALATIFLAPLAVGILVFHGFLAPESIAPGIIVFLFEAYLGYAYWDKYKGLFQRN